MKNIRQVIVAFALMLVSASAFGQSTEELRYSWRLRGGVRFLAGLIFPTSGVGNLRTTLPKDGEHTVHSELLMTAPTGKQGGYYAYESEIDDRDVRTLMTYNGYAWGKKSRNERTVFDYVKRLARMRKQTPEVVENRVKKLPEGDEMRDVLTAIYFMRQNAPDITGPRTWNIYTDGKQYPVILRPGVQKTFVVGGKQTSARVYEIVDAPGGKKWQGGIKVWLSADERRLPVRIEIQQGMASMQLDLQAISEPLVASR